MSLPTSRPRTYVDGDPLIPDDINEVFDAIIGAKRPSMTLWSLPTGWAQTSGVAGGAFTVSDSGYVSFGSGKNSMASAGALADGTRITGAKVKIQGPATNTGLYSNILLYLSRGSAVVSLAELDYLDGATNPWEIKTVVASVASPYVLAAGESLFWSIAPQYDFKISAFGLIVDRL